MGAREWVSLYWCSIPINGRPPIPVYLASDDTDITMGTPLPGGIRMMGYCYRKGWEIFIWAGQDKADTLDTLLHEILHATRNKGCKLTKKEEEKAFGVLAPNALKTLRAMGWAPPPLPEGARALGAHARWVRYGRDQTA